MITQSVLIFLLISATTADISATPIGPKNLLNEIGREKNLDRNSMCMIDADTGGLDSYDYPSDRSAFFENYAGKPLDLGCEPRRPTYTPQRFIVMDKLKNLLFRKYEPTTPSPGNGQLFRAGFPRDLRVSSPPLTEKRGRDESPIGPLNTDSDFLFDPDRREAEEMPRWVRDEDGEERQVTGSRAAGARNSTPHVESQFENQVKKVREALNRIKLYCKGKDPEKGSNNINKRSLEGILGSSALKKSAELGYRGKGEAKHKRRLRPKLKHYRRSKKGLSSTRLVAGDGVPVVQFSQSLLHQRRRFSDRTNNGDRYAFDMSRVLGGASRLAWDIGEALRRGKPLR